ncbi:hypothetical protein [Pseudomonas vranovensis]
MASTLTSGVKDGKPCEKIEINAQKMQIVDILWRCMNKKTAAVARSF